MKRQVAIMISIAATSFLIRALSNISFMAIGSDNKTWDKVWTAISELQTKLGNLNASYIDLLRRVEILEYPKNGFVGFWSFNEGSGLIAHYDSGNSNDGGIYGPSWVEGKLGSALSFDGVDDYVEIMHSQTLSFSSFTLMAWVKFRTFPNYGDVSMIVAKGNDDRQNGHFGLHQYFQGKNPSNPEVFHFYLRENDQWYTTDGTTHLAVGEWYHVAGTYGGSALKIYVNGVLEGDAVVNVPRTYNTRNLQIGALRMWGYFTDGTIDEVKVYNRALAAQEIKEQYIGIPA